MERLKAACLNLPKTSVQEEEDYVARDPILIVMSTVLSLRRRWYLQALPARNHFESEVYRSVTPQTLDGMRTFIVELRSRGHDWESVALKLWDNKEKTKARIFADLLDYFINWHRKNVPTVREIDALREWAGFTSKADFSRQINGLGPRAYEQLLWYIDGKQAIKFDVHVANFVRQAVGRTVADEEAIEALRQIAIEIGISATALDARIWDYMQARCGALKVQIR